PEAASHEQLKKEFRVWLRKEAQVLSALLVVGTVGVYVYQNRENAPNKQVLKLLARAEECAKDEDRETAVRLCLQAHALTKATNSRDRHLFELAFAIAAQYETLGRVNKALLFYQEALGSLPYVPDAAKREASHVVTLDRIAQCFQDKGEQTRAERYYREAIDVYDKSLRRATGVTPAESSGDAGEQVDSEIPAVLFNYGQQLMHLGRWEEAATQLRRARKLANEASLSSEHVAKIESLLFNVSAATATGDDCSVSDESSE
ncbi:hypothetical protein PybrP1_006113, partial [[Pythium] brassicae (nom. inval.)]